MRLLQGPQLLPLREASALCRVSHKVGAAGFTDTASGQRARGASTIAFTAASATSSAFANTW
jgi:hypothetical protein